MCGPARPSFASGRTRALSPRRQSGVCVAPQFEHSALTPPGAEFSPELGPRRIDGFTLVAVALGPEERVDTDCVRSVSVPSEPTSTTERPVPGAPT